MKRIALLLLGLLAAAGLAARTRQPDTTPVGELDLERYMGRWYEIARFDHRFERGLDHVEALYRTDGEGRITVENSGTELRTGERKRALGKARPGRRAGQLRVSFFWIFYADYNVLALGDRYEWALVGSSSPKYLWILARTPELPEATLDEILQLARSRGYDTGRLIYVDQRSGTAAP